MTLKDGALFKGEWSGGLGTKSRTNFLRPFTYFKLLNSLKIMSE